VIDYSPRFDALEKDIRPQGSLGRFEVSAARRGIPITAESQTGSSETMVRVPLNGTMIGRELRLTFHRDFGLRKASISSRWSDRERQLFNIAVDEY